MSRPFALINQEVLPAHVTLDLLAMAPSVRVGQLVLRGKILYHNNLVSTTDIDECLSGDHSCSGNAICANERLQLYIYIYM